MKKIRHRKGFYREERKIRIKVNEELVATNRAMGKFDRNKRFRIHTWFIAYQKNLKREFEKEGEEFDGSFKF